MTEQGEITPEDYQVITTFEYQPPSRDDFHSNVSPSEQWMDQDDLLAYHFDRLLEAAAAHKFAFDQEIFKGKNSLGRFRNEVKKRIADDNANHTKLRVRVGWKSDGSLSLESVPLAPPPDSGILHPFRMALFSRSLQLLEASPDYKITCAVHLCPKATQPSLFTRHKTDYRKVYDIARSAITPPLGSSTPPYEREVLLHNPSNEITEASTSTPYFYRFRNTTDDQGWITPALSSGGCNSVTRRITVERGACEEQIIKLDEVKDGEVIWLSNAVRGWWLGRIVVGRKGREDGR